MRYAIVFVLAALAVPTSAQESTKPIRSMADGLVRQWIEREQLRPPHLESGVELGTGKGPMVLMIWRPDGSTSLHELQRGHGDFGPAAKKRSLLEELIDEEIEEEEVEEVEELEEEELEEEEAAEAEQRKAEQKKAGSGSAGAGRAKQPKPGGKPLDAAMSSHLSVELRRTGDLLVIVVPGRAEPIEGAEVDRATLRPALQQLLALRDESGLSRQLVIRARSKVLMRDLLTVWELAQSLGFEVCAQGKSAEDVYLHPAVEQQIAGLAEKFGWPVKQVAVPGRAQPICDGELLVLIEGRTEWGQVLPLFWECARAGIWQLGFVGQQDARTRCKLPTHLPFDKGLVK